MGKALDEIRSNRPVRIRKQYSILPGDALEQFFSKWGIKQKHETCGCRKVQNKMNALGPEGCECNLKQLVLDTQKSIIEWKEGSRIIPTPPKLLIELSIKHAINVSKKSVKLL